MQIRPDTHNRGSQQRLGKIAIYTLLCFSLAGLIAGFAFGGFLGNGAGSALEGPHTTPVVTATIPTRHVTPTPGITPTVEDVEIGEPVLSYTSSEKTGGTVYTLRAQIIDKNTKAPITATDVTCKLWLTKDSEATGKTLSANHYAIPTAINRINQPVSGEVQGAFSFEGSSKQVQPCAARGQTTWTYTLSSKVKHGAYFFVVLADWKGKHYNWYITSVSISEK